MLTHDQLADKLEARLDKIEDKLDKHLEIASTNKADIAWTKGYIRVSLALFTTLIGGVATSLFRLFIKS